MSLGRSSVREEQEALKRIQTLRKADEAARNGIADPAALQGGETAAASPEGQYPVPKRAGNRRPRIAVDVTTNYKAMLELFQTKDELSTAHVPQDVTVPFEMFVAVQERLNHYHGQFDALTEVHKRTLADLSDHKKELEAAHKKVRDVVEVQASLGARLDQLLLLNADVRRERDYNAIEINRLEDELARTRDRVTQQMHMLTSTQHQVEELQVTLLVKEKGIESLVQTRSALQQANRDLANKVRIALREQAKAMVRGVSTSVRLERLTKDASLKESVLNDGNVNELAELGDAEDSPLELRGGRRRGSSFGNAQLKAVESELEHYKELAAITAETKRTTTTSLRLMLERTEMRALASMDLVAHLSAAHRHPAAAAHNPDARLVSMAKADPKLAKLPPSFARVSFPQESPFFSTWSQVSAAGQAAAKGMSLVLDTFDRYEASFAESLSLRDLQDRWKGFMPGWKAECVTILNSALDGLAASFISLQVTERQAAAKILREVQNVEEERRVNVRTTGVQTALTGPMASSSSSSSSPRANALAEAAKELMQLQAQQRSVQTVNRAMQTDDAPWKATTAAGEASQLAPATAQPYPSVQPFKPSAPGALAPSDSQVFKAPQFHSGPPPVAPPVAASSVAVVDAAASAERGVVVAPAAAANAAPEALVSKSKSKAKLNVKHTAASESSSASSSPKALRRQMSTKKPRAAGPGGSVAVSAAPVTGEAVGEENDSDDSDRPVDAASANQLPTVAVSPKSEAVSTSSAAAPPETLASPPTSIPPIPATADAVSGLPAAPRRVPRPPAAAVAPGPAVVPTDTSTLTATPPPPQVEVSVRDPRARFTPDVSMQSRRVTTPRNLDSQGRARAPILSPDEVEAFSYVAPTESRRIAPSAAPTAHKSVQADLGPGGRSPPMNAPAPPSADRRPSNLYARAQDNTPPTGAGTTISLPAASAPLASVSHDEAHASPTAPEPTATDVTPQPLPDELVVCQPHRGVTPDWCHHLLIPRAQLTESDDALFSYLPEHWFEFHNTLHQFLFETRKRLQISTPIADPAAFIGDGHERSIVDVHAAMKFDAEALSALLAVWRASDSRRGKSDAIRKMHEYNTRVKAMRLRQLDARCISQAAFMALGIADRDELQRYRAERAKKAEQLVHAATAEYDDQRLVAPAAFGQVEPPAVLAPAGGNGSRRSSVIERGRTPVRSPLDIGPGHARFRDADEPKADAGHTVLPPIHTATRRQKSVQFGSSEGDPEAFENRGGAAMMAPQPSSARQPAYRMSSISSRSGSVSARSDETNARSFNTPFAIGGHALRQAAATAGHIDLSASGHAPVGRMTGPFAASAAAAQRGSVAGRNSLRPRQSLK